MKLQILMLFLASGLSVLSGWYYRRTPACFNVSLYKLFISINFILTEQGERDGIWAWHRINRLFNWLPLAALIEKKIVCMHGGIGRSINHVEQIENIQRPITMEAG